MTLRVGRTIPPAAAPIHLRDIVAGMQGLIRGQRALDRFESELRAYFGVKHCFLVSSGKAALTCILLALKDIFPERNEVLIPAFTCFSVPSAVTRAGLKVRLCDVDPVTLDFDFGLLSRVFEEPQNGGPETVHASNDILAVVSTHLFGLPADIAKLNAVLKDSGITIIEDAAQAMGAEWQGQKLGTLADVSFFSLGRGKAFSTVEGGIILTNRSDIADRIKAHFVSLTEYTFGQHIALLFKSIALCIFLNPWTFWFPSSIPLLRLGETIYNTQFTVGRMSAFQAGLARHWRKKIRSLRERRKENVKEWWGAIPNSVSLKHPCLEYGNVPDLIRFPIKLRNRERRDAVTEASYKMGLGIMQAYPSPIDEIQGLQTIPQGQLYPIAKELANSLVTLPVHSFLTKLDKDRIRALLTTIGY